MKKYSLFILAILFALTGNIHAQKETSNLTIMSYNIRNGMGMDEITELNRTAQVINHMQPDLLALQEVDKMTGRNKLDVLKELATKTNMHYTYAAAIDFDGGEYGIGLLSKEKPIRSEQIPLPGREEKRVLLVAEFEKYVILCTHLSLTPEDQLASVAIINSEVDKVTDKPVFLAGDLNVHPHSDVIKELNHTFTILSDTTAYTYPADVPAECIDYIMIGKKYEVFAPKFQFVYNEPLASDHRPIVVGLRFGGH